MLPAQLHQLQFLLPRDIAEGELQCLVQAAFNGLVRHREPMVGDADVPHHTLRFCFQYGLVQAGAVAGLGAEGRIVELVQIDVVRPQIVQRGVQVLPELLRVLGGGLGSDVDLRADAVEGLPQLHLAVGIGPGSVEEADASPIRLPGQMHRIFLRNALDGQRTKAVFVHRDAGAAQSNHIHGINLTDNYGSGTSP